MGDVNTHKRETQQTKKETHSCPVSMVILVLYWQYSLPGLVQYGHASVPYGANIGPV